MKRILWLFSLLLITGSLVMAQTVMISGAVTGSEDGLPIPGVNITVKGTTMGAISGTDGKYSLSVPASAQSLLFSFIGFVTQEVPISGRTSVDVVLVQDLYNVDEVVVVGYGVQRKSEVTGSIASVKGAALASLATPSFDAQLAGRSAGVQITQQTGVIGEAPRLRIRGIGSISSGNYPLVVLDGVPILTGDLGGYASTNALGDINPADIESMEILKDGSATAIYGSRASAGVILITTKRGAAGISKLNVNYNNYFGYASPVRLFDLLNADEFVMINNEKRSQRGQADIAFNDGAAYPGQTFDTDWQTAVLRKRAFQMDHNLSLSGSTAGSSYYFSLGYSDQKGVTRPNEMQRYTARANVDQRVTKWLSMGTSVGLTQSEYYGLNTGTNALSGNIFSAIRQHPNVPIYNPDHSTGYNIDTNPDYVGRWNNLESIGDNLPNIVYVIDHNVFSSRILRTLGNLYAQIKFLPSLNFKTQLGIDGSKTDGFLYYNAAHGDGKSVNGRVQNNFSNNLRWNLQNILTYSDTFADAHNLTVVLVQEAQFTRNNNFNAVGTDLSNEFFNKNIISGTVGTMSVGGGMSENGFISYAGRINYNFKGRYFLQGSLRYDGISALPEANKWGIFPGGSLGWTVTREPFMSGITNILSDLKVRTSYAQVGNTSIGNYPYLGLYGSAKYADYNGIAFSQIGNDQLQWETSKKFDVGFDALFFDGKYKFSFDYYLNDQDGLILSAPIPNSLGVPGNSIDKNIGQLRNWGFEFSGEAYIFRKGDFSWQVDANLTLARNEVISLVAGQDITAENTIIREGESMSSIYGYEYLGVNAANGNPLYQKADGTVIQGNIPNSTYYVYDASNPTDLTTSSTLSSTLDKKIFGPSLPTFYGGINSRVNYKGFDFTVMFRYSGGNYIMNSTRRDLVNLNFVNNGSEILGRWQSVDAPGDGWTPRLWFAGATFVNLTGHATTRFIEKGDFLKLQTLTLGYTLPNQVVKKVGLTSLRIFAQGQDILMLTKYTGIDPEMESGGVDLNGTPRQKVITFGINLGL
ncbi:MAG: SusC/RagA family protein [Bacteroidetes bacterium RBG_19FT_COMBO_42_7]|nr:MAG: SusC/RagA family protein [Bacteroidetes bacterium RBG_19FT_COMBO_42_7]